MNEKCNVAGKKRKEKKKLMVESVKPEPKIEMNSGVTDEFSVSIAN